MHDKNSLLTHASTKTCFQRGFELIKSFTKKNVEHSHNVIKKLH